MWLSREVIWRWVVVGIIVLGAMTWGYFIITANQAKQLMLPVYGDKNIDGSDHTIKDFRLIDQDGKIISQDNFKDKIYVSDFFFTTCQGICPVMNDQMERIAEKYKDNKNLLLLSHTVKPEEDSLRVLNEYAKNHNADPDQWYFVTGEKKIINDLAQTSYLVGETTGDTPEDFVHTQFFTLIDTHKRIRGFYDGTDSTDVNKLIADISILLKEE